MELSKSSLSAIQQGSIPKPLNSLRNEVKTTGSATGTIRNKVALQPGHSLLDWIKLGHSGKDLTGVGGVYQTITLDQLAKHNKKDDAWIAIKGQVFNVTHYLDFHPGGPEELIRGVGTDATKLFNEVHAWVNVESMLQKCLVGRLKPSKGDSRILRSKESLAGILFSKLKANENGAVKNGGPGEPKTPGFSSPLIDWFQKPESITLLLYTRRPGVGDNAPCVRVVLKDKLRLEVKLWIVKNSIFYSFTLPIPLKGPVVWPCSLKLIPDIGKIEIVIQKKNRQIWPDLVNPKLISPQDVIYIPFQDFKSRCNGENNGSGGNNSVIETKYQSCTVMEILPVNHDTKMFILKHVSDVCDLIPIGYHVLLRADVNGVAIERNYTPVVPALHSDFWPLCVPPKDHNGPFPSDLDGNWLALLIKSTEGGALSPWLCDGGLSVGSTLLISECIAPGIKNEEPVAPPPFHMGQSPVLLRSSKDTLELLLLAAGTGLTPMVRVILWSLQIPANQCKKVNLIFFNKTEKDIIWRDQLDRLMADCSRFTVKYVLSNAEPGWKGEEGIIRSGLIKPYFFPSEENSTTELSKHFNVYTCICGPIPFTRAAQKILLDFGVESKDYFSFLG